MIKPMDIAKSVMQDLVGSSIKNMDLMEVHTLVTDELITQILHKLNNTLKLSSQDIQTLKESLHEYFIENAVSNLVIDQSQEFSLTEFQLINNN